MPVVTLTTDWNNADYYLGALKGRIISQCKDAVIQDISHAVSPFNALQAAFIIRNCYNHFPVGSVHILGIHTEASPGNPVFLIFKNGHYFIGSERGGIGLIFDEVPDIARKILIGELSESSVNSGYLYLADIASTLLSNLEGIDQISENYPDFKPQISFRPVFDENVINGSILYIDSFQNAICNIEKDLFEKIGHKRPYEILVRSNHYRIRKLSKKYDEVPAGELTAFFNSLGLLEIAIRNGNAAQLLNLGINSEVRIKFLNPEKVAADKLF